MCLFACVVSQCVHAVCVTVYTSVHAEVPPYTVDAVKEKAFPKNLDIQQALLKRKQLRDFFTEESKFSPCIACFSSPMF